MATLTGFFTEIADAIREVEGSAEAIPAPTFPDRIRNLTVAVDFTRLAAAIASATSAKNAAKVNGSGDYDFGTKVTTQAAIDALATAITTAQGVYDTYKTGPVTQKLLDDGQKALEAALATFNASITEVTADTSALTAQESRYTTLKTGVTTSTDGKDVTFGSKWVTSAEQGAADTALSTARSTVEAATKQSQINAAVSTLKGALDTYEKAIKTATKDTAALDDAITAANAAKADVETSDDEGADLPAGSKYVTTEQMTAFNAAIAAATTAKTASTTQAQLDAATSALTTATSTFEGQIKTNFVPPEDIASAPWADVIQLANLAAADPESYTKHLGQEKTLTIGGKTVTARIVEVGKQKLANGGTCGFVFNVYKGMDTHVMNASGSNSGGYAKSEMKTWLEGLAFDPEVSSALQTMEFGARPSSSASAETIQAKFALMSHANVFSGKESSTSAQYVFADEGERYRYFAQNDTNAARIHYNAGGGANFAWLLTPRSNTTRFRGVGSGGAPGGSDAGNSYLPAARFCLGSSV